MSTIIDGTAGITFPVTAGGTSAVQASSGKVLQVVQGTTGTQTNTSSSTFIDTNLTATITPSNASNKILVIVQQSGCGKTGGNTGVNIRLQRSGTTIQTITDAGFYNGTTTDVRFNVVSSCYLDSPATTSATTYKTQFANYNSGVGLAYVNDLGNIQPTSTITLMEIAA